MMGLKEFKTPAVKIIASENITDNYATWIHRNRIGGRSGHCIGESLESTVKRLLLFCDTFASAGDVIEVKTNFDKNLFLDAIKVERPYIISLV